MGRVLNRPTILLTDDFIFNLMDLILSGKTLHYAHCDGLEYIIIMLYTYRPIYIYIYMNDPVMSLNIHDVKSDIPQ